MSSLLDAKNLVATGLLIVVIAIIFMLSTGRGEEEGEYCLCLQRLPAPIGKDNPISVDQQLMYVCPEKYSNGRLYYSRNMKKIVEDLNNGISNDGKELAQINVDRLNSLLTKIKDASKPGGAKIYRCDRGIMASGVMQNLSDNWMHVPYAIDKSSER